jgi:glutamate/aspartate transport system permease protein
MNLDFAFFNWGIVLQLHAQGLIFSVQLTLIAMVGGIVLGTVLALMRLSGKPWLVMPAAPTSTRMRSHPAGDGDPVVLPADPAADRPADGGRAVGHHHLHVFEAAYYSEIMRAGIQSVPKGQVHAGYAVGMTYAQTMQLIVLPQAFRNMLPVLLTQTIILFQDTSLVYAIGAYDLLKGFEVAGKNFNRPVETYLVAAVVYFVICFSLSMLVKRCRRRSPDHPLRRPR